MTMKTFYAGILISFFILAPLGAISVFAQEPSSGEEHQPPSADEIVAKMKAKLNLTQEQASAITPIIERYSSKREELRQSMEDGTADRDSIHSQMKQLKTDESQELSQVLSADQLSQWEQMQSQGRHKHGGDGSGAGASGSGGENAPSGQ